MTVPIFVFESMKMKNKALLFTFLILMLSSGGYYVYNYVLQPKSIGYWDLVPSTAVAVYERSECDRCVDSLTNVPWLKLFRDKLLRDAVGDTAYVAVMLGVVDKAEMISMHRTTKNDFDFVFYARTNEVVGYIQPGVSAGDIKKRERIYDGLPIHERSFGRTTLAWVQKDSYTALSLSSILIEDVIRAFNSQGVGSFQTTVGEVIVLPTVKNDGGQVLLNLNEYKNWVTSFGEAGSINLSSIGKGSLLDVKRAGNALVLNGFSAVDTADRQSLLSVFEGQAPVAFNFKRFVSNEAQYVVDFGFSDTKLLGEKLQQGLSNAERSALLKVLTIGNEELIKLYEGLGQELTIVSLETISGQSATVVMVDVKGGGKWNEILDQIAKNTSTDTVFVEQFSSYSIRKIPVGGLVELVFPVLFKKYSELYYVQVGNAIMLAEDMRALKMTLEDFDEENTWGKSVEKNRFLESTLLESNVSFYVDPTRCRKLVLDALHSDWKKVYLSNNTLISPLGLSAAQFSFLNSNFYTNLYLTFSDGSKASPIKMDREVLVSLASGISSKAFVVKNHNDRSQEIVVQDSSKQIYLINTKGEILWQKKLDGFIKGQVEQIDYFANGKLQLLISTEKSIHVIDRLGNYVRPYPVELSFSNEMIRVVDYDHSKRYRFLLADKHGVLYMMDKESTTLEGWQGLGTGGELVTEPRHFRISARDYISVLQKDGEFTLYNRRGERLKNFPVNIKGRPLSGFYYDEDDRTQRPGFVFVNTEGFRVKVALNGEEISRETLMKPTIDTHFRLIVEENEKAYVIVRQGTKALTVLSDKLEEIVVNEFVGLNKADVQNFDFGSGKIYYTINDTEQNLGYVYNSAGNLLTIQPVECDYLSLMWSHGKLWMITTLGTQLRLRVLEGS